MFEQTFVADGNTKRERTIAFALVMQTLGITGLALLPLLNTEPIGAGKRFLLLPPAFAKPDPPPVVKQSAGPRSSTPVLRVVQIESLTHRFVAPTHVSPLQADDAPVLGVSSATNTGTAVGDLLMGLGPSAVQPPPRTPATPKPTHAPVRVSSGITQSRLILGPKPSYPRLALAARIAATVRLQATISRDGRIENLHVLSGHPLLNDAAMDAVRQWRYRPLLLNGDPVEVITEIDVSFTLNP